MKTYFSLTLIDQIDDKPENLQNAVHMIYKFDYIEEWEENEL